MHAITATGIVRPRSTRSRSRKKASSSSAAAAARRQAARERLITLTRLMDGLFEIPVLGRRVGLDALIGVVPVAGDLVSAGVGLYLAFEARQLGASRWLQARMIGNLLLDFLVGAVPVLGDFFDVLFRAHQRNLSLLQRELGEPYIDASR
ncbi:MAG: DUF4112 domain-containing protein [Burkholderiales bacterium]|jgi:hypothetical protein|nr:MAG: DUF4112 domain-containing protein [Burkholderiales bacterium]